MKRILVAECEMIVAMSLESALIDAGFEPVGPGTTPEEIIGLIASNNLHCGVFDLGVLADRGEDILAPLVERGTPILYLTGRDINGPPDNLPPARIMRKPSHLSDVVTAVAQLIEDHERR